MSLVNSRVGPASVKQRRCKTYEHKNQTVKDVKLPHVYSNLFYFDCNAYFWYNREVEIQTSQIKKGCCRQIKKVVGLPMALRAWLSSRLNALIGTSSPTGRTATVERLLAGLVTSALVVIVGRLRAEPGRQEHSE